MYNIDAWIFGIVVEMVKIGDLFCDNVPNWRLFCAVSVKVVFILRRLFFVL